MPSYLQSKRTPAIYIATGASFALISTRTLLVPLYAHQLGANRFEVGALFSVAMLAAAALSIPSGLVVDRFGARNVLAVSLFLSLASQLATAASTTVFPLFVWQLTGGLALGAQQAAFLSAVTESVSRSRLGRAMGWLTASMQAGFFTGPALAGVALQWLDLRADIAFCAVLLIFAVPGCLVVSSTRQSRDRLSLRLAIRGLITQRAFVPVTLGLAAATLVWGVVGAFLPIFAKESLGLTGPEVGWLLAIQAVVNGVSRLPGGWVVDRVRRRWALIFGGVIGWSATAVILGHLTGFLTPVIVLALGTPFMALAFVAIGVVFANLSAGSTRGVTMGTYGAVLFLGLAIGPLLFGQFVQSSGYAAGFTACAIVAVGLVILMAAIQTEALRRPVELYVPPPTPSA